jgi:hypothetical protein
MGGTSSFTSEGIFSKRDYFIPNMDLGTLTLWKIRTLSFFTVWSRWQVFSSLDLSSECCGIDFQELVAIISL